MSIDTGVLEQIFHACDPNQTGYIEKEELARICAGLELNQEEFDDIFQDLDLDNDGRISKYDFVAGFTDVCQSFAQKKVSSQTLKGPGLDSILAWENFLEELGLDYYLISSKRYEIETCNIVLYRFMSTPP